MREKGLNLTEFKCTYDAFSLLTNANGPRKYDLNMLPSIPFLPYWYICLFNLEVQEKPNNQNPSTRELNTSFINITH